MTDLPNVQIVTCSECHEPVIKAKIADGWITLEPRESLYAYDPKTQRAVAYNSRRQVDGVKCQLLTAHETRRCRAVLAARLDQKAKEQREAEPAQEPAERVRAVKETAERYHVFVPNKPKEPAGIDPGDVKDAPTPVVPPFEPHGHCETCNHPERKHFSGICGVDGCTCPF